MSRFLLEKNINIFKCPICGGKTKIKDFKSIVCSKKHCFDLSKSDYINLLMNSSKNDYDKKMLQSRKQVCKQGFFDPLLDSIGIILLKQAQDNIISCTKILDAGCGEGSHLARLAGNIHGKLPADVLGVGIDISKEGIQIAAKEYPNFIWCVADLAKIPFQSEQFNVVINILAPSNYEEFRRVLRDDGILIKVVPGSNYLCELRNVFYSDTDRQKYSNERVIKHFENNFNTLNVQKVQYSRAVNKDSLEQLIKMTPLSWGTSEENVQKALNTGIDNISVDYSIIIGKKLSESL